MELHNIVEEIVISKVKDIFDSIEERGDPDKLCTCSQCRIDTACYVLNRTSPIYLVSNRGAARIQKENIEYQQKKADISALIYEGLKRINHNQRPETNHGSPEAANIHYDRPVYNIPTITGRIFNGGNFAPISGVRMELYYNNTLVAMKDRNWQNPLNLVSYTDGNFTFWPVAVPAEKTDDHTTFEYTLKVDGEGFETITHVFRIPVISEIQTTRSFSLERTFKLPDLFMFPPGGDDRSRYLAE